MSLDQDKRKHILEKLNPGQLAVLAAMVQHVESLSGELRNDSVDGLLDVFWKLFNTLTEYHNIGTCAGCFDQIGRDQRHEITDVSMRGSGELN